MEKNLLLSEPVVEGLKQLSTKLSLTESTQLIEKSVKCMLDTTTEQTANEKNELMQYAIVTLLTEATKHCVDQFVLREELQKLDLTKEVLEELLRVYGTERKNLTVKQFQIGQHFPHITEVQWRIVSDIKSSTCVGEADEIGFQINLGRYREDGTYETIVEFLASTEELQSIISKLKDIERHCEKLSNE